MSPYDYDHHHLVCYPDGDRWECHPPRGCGVSGSTSAFQAEGAGSNPVTRSQQCGKVLTPSGGMVFTHGMTTNDIDFTDPQVIDLIVNDPAVNARWTAWKQVQEAGRAGLYAGGPDVARKADAAARELWATEVRRALGEVAR